MKVNMLFGLHDRPPFPTAVLVGLQHVLAVTGGIIAAPLIVALAMDLEVKDISYLISCSLVISGLATLIQIRRIGFIGSGLLSIQGTSFTFIGPLIFAYSTLIDGRSPQETLGVIMGCCAACAVCMMLLSQFIHKLKSYITTNVSGTTVTLIGLSLVWTTANNLNREFTKAETADGSGWQVLALAACVLAITFTLSRSKVALVRISSITIGLSIGFLIALAMGLIDFSKLSELNWFFIPMPNHFALGFDWAIFLLLLPIFVISATETLGDLTAASKLSGLTIGDSAYWTRIKGGVAGDAFNSLLAAVFGTFPNTSFSQNNGVIRITGVSSTYVGNYTAVILCLLGLFPLFGGLFIVMPGAVLYGATILMFFMVFLSGFNIVSAGEDGVKNWWLVGVAVCSGMLLSVLVPHMGFIPQWLKSLLQFPISTGALIAVLLEFIRANNLYKKPRSKLVKPF